jgi:PAS domain S-box-containing protein
MHKTSVGDEIITEGRAADITPRKNLEQDLRIFSRAVDQSPVSIIITDTGGLIRYVNSRFSHLTGYPSEEVLGRNPSILKTGTTSREEYSILWKTINSGAEWSGEFCNRKKNGELYWETALISPIINEKGVITHFVAIKEDITIQKETDRRIQSSIIEAEERERLHFSQELHDGIGPLLSAIKMYVQWLEMPNAKIKQSEIIKDIDRFLDESSRTIHEISFKLSPHILQNFGLIEALKMYTGKVKESSNVTIELKSETICRFDKNTETIAYRILCECINNTIKHANASGISIDLQCDKGVLLIEYTDNGKGFNPEETLALHKGIGLLNMQSRLKSVDGSMDIISKPGNGTTIKFQMKIQENL